jgi:hypothetical protein
MMSHFGLLRQAVQAMIDAEWANLRAGIHHPGAGRADAVRQRDIRLNEVFRRITAIRDGDVDGGCSMETRDEGLKLLARACSDLSSWERLMPTRLSFPSPVLDPDPEQIVALEKRALDEQADEFLTELCEGVNRVLHRVLDLEPRAASASARILIPATEAAELSERLACPVSLSRISKLCRREPPPFYSQAAPPGSQYKVAVDKAEFLLFLAADKKPRDDASEAEREGAFAEAIEKARQAKKAKRPLD